VAGDSLLELTEPANRSSNVFEALRAFGYDSGHRLVVPGDDNLFASCDPFQQLAETGFGCKGADGSHRILQN
jgi:hypothetical protein